jgi:peptidoglycan/xylan/chitin deacetylase (PgdA/CDA1 family)
MKIRKFINNFYYLIRPVIPRIAQIKLRQFLIKRKIKRYTDIWPIDRSSAKSPTNWKGWPKQKRFALILTHDVETDKGLRRCSDLLKLEKELGFKSSFNFVPERYDVSRDLMKLIMDEGFEVGVHGLKHDGKLLKSKQIFLERAEKINKYLFNWKAEGFRSPAMHHNLEWFHHLNIQYDLSTFDTDPFEPQSDGVATIFPFWIEGEGFGNGYVELPYTLAQDSTLFILLQEKNIDIWKQKIEWISEKGGMALVNVHPDYMNFDNSKCKFDEFPVNYYIELLTHVKNIYRNTYWHVLPKEMAIFWEKIL